MSYWMTREWRCKECMSVCEWRSEMGTWLSCGRRVYSFVMIERSMKGERCVFSASKLVEEWSDEKKANILEVGSVGRMLKTRGWDKNKRNIKTGEGGKGGSCWIFTHEWNVREMYMCVASMWSVVGGWKVEVWLFAGWVHCGGCTDKPIKMSYLWRIDIPWRVGEMCILVDSRVTVVRWKNDLWYMPGVPVRYSRTTGFATRHYKKNELWYMWRSLRFSHCIISLAL